jgi:hypothetical protein
MVELENIAPRNESETVAAFRAAIHDHFSRFTTFYDATNNEMRNYRLIHVDNIRINYQGLMRDFGYAIEYLRARGGNQYPANLGINTCARQANASLTDALSTYFYPTFALVQERTSTLPMVTLDALRRGNVIVDSEEILGYLSMQYDAYRSQWLQTVSKFFRWEKTKVDITSDFYQEEMNLCLCRSVPESSRCPQFPIPTGEISFVL